MAGGNPTKSIRMPQELKDRFESFLEENNLNALEFIQQAMDCLSTKVVSEGQTKVLSLSDEDEKLVSQACKVSNMTYQELLYKGLIAYASKRVTMAQNLEKMSDDDLEKTTVAGAAFVKIQRAVESVIQHNESCEQTYDKIFISPSIIFKITGSNRKSINDWFEQNSDFVSKHNAKHGLDVGSNRKGKGYDVKATLGL